MMNADRTDLTDRILQELDALPDPEIGMNLLGMAGIFRDVSMSDIEQAVRELLSEGKVRYYAADDLEEDGSLAAVVRTEPGWATDLLDRINSLPEAP